MTLREIGSSKTKLAVAGTILSLVIGLVDYTVRATLAYAEVKSDIRNLTTLMNEKQDANEQEHAAFRADIRALWRGRTVDRFEPQ